MKTYKEWINEGIDYSNYSIQKDLVKFLEGQMESGNIYNALKTAQYLMSSIRTGISNYTHVDKFIEKGIDDLNPLFNKFINEIDAIKKEIVKKNPEVIS